ncbi:MAG: hypothetical protein KGR24_03200 [Planctomycetes bacterium]|nr:hypothetical protein [Planctomycetota bacterium]
MLRTLRILLIGAATLATLLVGLRDSLADVLPCGVAIRSVDGDTYDGSREDDSGTLSESEQVEEDDTEEQEGREIHLFAAAALKKYGLDSPLHLSSLPAPCSAAKMRSCATHVRGPPTIR